MGFTALAIKAYYKLTIHKKRALPTTEAELSRLKAILTLYHGMDDTFESWVTVLGRIQSTQGTSLKASYASLVNPALRLKTNKLAQDEKILAIQKNQAMLEAKLKDKIDEVLASEGPQPSTEHDWTHPINSGVPIEHLPGGTPPVKDDLQRMCPP